jgi:coproporphyrinogen III oxidase-like Fe-S oxidoreductase
VNALRGGEIEGAQPGFIAPKPRDGTEEAVPRLLVEQHEKLTAESALEEELFLGLRQLDGIDVARIEREYGVALKGRFDPLASAGLLEREGGMVRLAPWRLSVSNEVFVELMR